MIIPEQNRRLNDDTGERLVRMESDVDHLKGSLDGIVDKLNVHIETNARGFEELRGHMQRLAISAEVQSVTSRSQADSMATLATTVASIVKNDHKIMSLEDFKIRTEAHLLHCAAEHKANSEKLTRTTEKVDRLYWIAPIILFVIQGAWELFAHFKIL